MKTEPVARCYEYLDEQAEAEVANQRHRNPGFNPSSIAKCSRQLGYQQLNTPKEVSPGFLRQYGPYGNFAHEHTQFLLRDAGCELAGLHFDDRLRTVTETDATNVTLTHKGQEITFRGRGDGRICIDGVWHYLEIKSVDAYKFRWMANSYQKGELEKYLRDKWDTYIQQSNMMCAPEFLDLPGTYLVIVNRSNCQLGFCDKNYENREGGVILPFDPELWEMQKNKAAMIARKAEAGELPLQGYVEGSKQCNQCDYAGRCWNG